MVVVIAAAASFLAGPALAQEPSYLGGKGRSPRYVPIPAPVPETFAWYVRLDVGVGTTGGDASQNGFDYGAGPNAGSYWADAPSRMSWFDSSSDAFFQGGIGFGRYLSPRFRMDATLDYKTADQYGASGSFSYDQVPPPPGGAPTGNTVLVTGTEDVEVSDGVMLINGYFDLVPRGRFTPYIGLGAGFAARFIERSHSSRETVFDNLGDPTGAFRTWNGDGKDTQFAPAVSATAGFTWAISQGTMLDVNYRYTYIGSVDTSMTIVASDASVQRSKITINESHQHAIRAGLRWNIW
jgi:opacity protein-like surface antigen